MMTALDGATLLDLERTTGQDDQIAQDSSLQNQSHVIIKRKLIFLFSVPVRLAVWLFGCLAVWLSGCLAFLTMCGKMK